jgi:UTP--glucose-1-phosphate uridylyltransferase
MRSRRYWPTKQVLAYRYQGKRFDCGSKLGYLKATVEFALRHPEVAKPFEAYLRAFLASRNSVPATSDEPLDETPELIG